MKNEILNHRYPITIQGYKRNIVCLLRKYITQRKWFHYLYHRLFGHRILDRQSGYAWCEYCLYHQELYLDELYPTFDLL